MLKGLKRTKALNELNQLIQSKAGLKGLAKTLALKRQNELRADLGMGKNVQSALNDDDIERLSQIDIDVQDDSTKGERKRTAREWIRGNLLGKTVRTVDGKIVHFNSNDTIDHISYNAMSSRNSIVTMCIPFVPVIFAKGEFVGRELPNHSRVDKSIKAFHLYRKWIKLKNGYQVNAEVQACERDGEKALFYAGYNLKALDKKKVVFDSLPYQGLHPADNVKNDTAPQNVDKHKTTFDYDNLMLDKMQDDIATNTMPLRILQVLDENGNDITDEILGDDWDGNDKTADAPQTAYQLADKATVSRRQKDNDAAVALLRELQTSGRAATTDEKAVLSRYTGTGGNLVGEDGLKGSDYEYYTPIEVAGSMWDLAAELGFEGGAVLDPSAGTGIFKAAAPKGTLMHSVELSDVSGRINALINDDDTHKVTVSPFEKVASQTDDETFDFVITNVPFGTNAARGANKQHDKLYQKDSLEEYFIKRSLDKLKPNKLAMFIVPTKILDGARYRKFRHSMALRAELVGAYRLPNKVFDKTGADVTTDIIVLKKFDKHIKDRIDSLNDNGGQKLLAQANVLDQDIIAGKYFKTYGKKYVLGEYQVGTGRYGDVVRVVNDDSLTNILKLVRKFGDSRIDYDLLKAQPIVERSLEDSDVRVLDGQTYEYQNGVWTAKEIKAYDEYPFVTVDNFIHKKPTKRDVQAYLAYLMSVGKQPQSWLSQLYDNAKNDDELYYYAVLTGVSQALAKAHSVPYANLYPDLTVAMANISNSYHTKRYKAKAYLGLQKSVAVAFDPIGHKGLSEFWYNGQAVQLDDMTLDSKQAYENAVYKGMAENWQVDVQTIRQINPDFDPLADEEFCINGDGSKVIAKKDYYVGNYGEFLAKIDAEIEQAKDPRIKEKLLKQKAYADSLIEYTDVGAISFGLMSSIVPMPLKYRFFNEFVDAATILVPHDQDDKELLKLDAKDVTDFGGLDQIDNEPDHHVNMRHFLLNRIFISINNNQKLTIDKSSWNDDNVVFTKLNDKLAKYFNELNINFNAWLRTQKDYMLQLEHDFNAPENKEFKTIADGEPFKIDNFQPKYDNFKSLHDYQFEEVRRLSRSFSGICGFGVGLGKTSTALATIQNMHNIGIKKRTFIIVPNHTISKWAKDIANMYDDMSDVLVIGTDENNNESASSKYYAGDFALLTQTKGKQYRKILMTVEAFGKIPMRKDHIIQYFDKDTGQRRTDKEKQESKLAEVVKKLNADEHKLPYFEDMAVDSLVMDEAQLFKNGLDGGDDFNRIRGLTSTSLDKLAARALSARVKSWWVRGQNKAKTGQDDGVVLLTATPFTNSPIEIMTMLSLAVGDDKAKKLLGGTAINSVSDFLSVFANIESIMQKDITGENISLDMFTGFQNVGLLKSVIHQVANIQTAKERGLKIPDEEHVITSTQLSDDDQAMLGKMKLFYRVAKQVEKGDMDGITPELFAEYQAYQEQIKEPDSTIGHAFSLIGRMSELTLVGSEMALNRNVVIHFDESQAATANKVADDFNRAKRSKNEFKTTRNYPLDDEFVTVKTKKDNDGNETNEYTVKARVSVQGDRLILNVDDATMLANLMELVEKHGLTIKPKLSAKVQALMENVKLELATPKHEGHAKQLIFCDVLSMHQIIKHALIGECGIPKSQIAILNAQTLPNGKAGSPDTEDVQEIQDLFADNTYTIVIANKKAETGIDLQKGTQAIHHITTGWTPDSLDQRNGRGVRQGNTQEKVMIYSYNADGTFDEYKRNLIAGKANWIDALMQKQTEVKGVLTVASQLSDQDYEDLIEADNAEAIQAIIQAKSEREQADRAKRVQAKNAFIFNNMDKARQQAQNTNFIILFKQKLLDDINAIIPMVRSNAGGETAKAKRVAKARAMLDAYSGLKIDKLWNMVQNKANNRANSYGSTASMTDIESVLVDEQAIRTQMNFPTGLASSKQWDELRQHKEQALIDALNVDNEAAKRIKNIISSRLQMQEATKQAFLNNDDSDYSREERQAIVDAKAAVHKDKLVYHNDIVTYQSHHNQIAYAIVQVYADGGVGFRTQSYQGYDKLEQFEKVKESERKAAIEFFVDYDFGQAMQNNLEKTEYRFSAVLDEVRQALFAKIDGAKGDFDNEWIEIQPDKVIHKQSGRAYGQKDLWDVFNNDDTRERIKKSYHAPMAHLVEQSPEQGEYIKIKRKNMAQFDKHWVMEHTFYKDHLRPFLAANDLKINLAANMMKTGVSWLAKTRFDYGLLIERYLGVEKRAFTPIKEYDDLVKKLADEKWGDVIGNIDHLLKQGLASLFDDREIDSIKQVLGERADTDPIIAKKAHFYEQAQALGVANKKGVMVIGLHDHGWALRSHKEQLKQIVGQDDKGKNLYEWNREQSIWIVPVDDLDKLTSQTWWDFDTITAQTPDKYA